MMPAYRIMDSNPYQRNQMPFPHHYHPGHEPFHPQMKMDPHPPKPSMVYEQSWPPYATSHSYPAPVHFCYGHNNFPSYCGSRPAYPHVSAPSPMYYPGSCPAYPDPYAIPYTPPPQYTMEIPRYEYDKYMPREYQYHCCGCPDHPCHQKEGNKSVKIEEQEPEVAKKVNDALVPAQSRNYLYPIVWIPPEYVSNREQKKPIAADMAGADKITRDPEYFKAGGQEEPRVWNGWFPFDMNGPPNMILDGDGRINQHLQTENNIKEFEDEKRDQNQKSENKSGGFPFPIIWMPYYNKPEEDGRKNNQETTSSTSSPKSTEEAPQNHIFKSVPVNFNAGEKAANGTNSEEESTNTDGSHVTKKVNKKSIPVKQMELHQGKDESESSTRGRNIPVKQMEENMVEADKESKTNVKGESTSPRKTSKLPPVCLRVDPLRRKTNGNGSSRSPSPPASKEHSQTAVGGTLKNPYSSGTSEKAQPDSTLQNVSNASEIVKPKEKIIEVLEKKTSGNDDENQMGGHKSSSGTSMRKESYTNGDERKIEENKSERMEEPVAEQKATEEREANDSNKTDDQCTTKRKVLSVVEAAALIQAAYRGFQVRKWEPLKKLKQISEVSKQVTEVSERIRALEASSDLQNDDKQRLTIGETIMRLLLKLDTIQGLHPSFRELRKCLARELTSLQEKLDSMMSKKSEQQMQDLPATKPVENIQLSLQDGKHMREQQEEQVAAAGKDPESTNQENHDTLKTCQDRIFVEDSISNIKPEKLPDDGSKESWPAGNPTYNNSGAEPVALQNEITNKDDVQVVTVDECSSENGLPEMECMSVENTPKTGVKSSEDGLSEVEDMAVENTPEPEGKGTPIDVDDFIMASLKELQQGVIDEESVNLDSGKNIKAELGRFEPQQTEAITMVMDDDSAQHGEVSEIDAIKELPVGILDEDPMIAQSEKHVETEPLNEAIVDRPVGLLDKEENSSQLEKCENTGTLKEAIAELPMGLLDDHTASSEFKKPEQTETSKEATAEQLVGLPNEDMTTSKLEKHEESRTSHEVQIAGKEEHEGTAHMNASADNTLTKNQSKQQQQVLLDDQTEVQATETEDSDGWLKVESQKDDKHHDASSEEFESHSEEGIHSDNEQQVSYQPVPSLSKAPENGDMIADQVIGGVADDTKIMAKKKDEQHHGGLNNHKKLIEENEKLREMMKKLLDAGNEQLNVISDLTDRLKDLEKQLARKKRLRAKGFRPGTTRPSCQKSSNNPLQGRKTVGVAM